ncbi:hypothetical protein CDL12_29757 [Handroanthus impetiginosus]|uniref:Uncharacterized protein n=1 Tax=Handroanthus impetiginosus TaxID=429701 RepID=A0A2G9FYN1_9LAMI|nr:hypothetical protein CDL12_29757 [Handroanthus impetiginosus]
MGIIFSKIGRNRPIPQRKSPLAEKEKEVTEMAKNNNKCTSLRPILVVKNKGEIKKFEDEEDCFILDFDPYNDIEFSKPSSSKDFDNDLRVVTEKGQVACRDYPHPRHTCAKFPFNMAPHYIHCNQCYCYVCDMAAPCKTWVDHCDAFKSES